MIRLGVIGYGNRINGVINACLRAVEPDIRVVGVVDPDEDGAMSRLAEQDRADVRFFDTVDDLVRQGRPDALAIGTRCNLHGPYAVEVASYDLPLYLEKPVAVSVDQAEALVRAFEDSSCEVVVSFPLRVSPLCVLAKQRLEDGAVGTPEHLLATNYVPYGTVYYDDAYRNYEITQGLFLQKATHDFDYISYLMDSHIVRVGAMATWGHIFGGDKEPGLVCSECSEELTCLESPRNRVRNHSGGSTADHACLFGSDIGTRETGMNEDSSSAVFELASGGHGIYTQVFYSRRDAGMRGARISGYMGTLSFDWYANELTTVRHHEPFTSTTKPDGGMSHFGGDVELAQDFIDVIKGHGRSRTTIWSGIQSVFTCLAARESAATGQFAEVKRTGAPAMIS